MTLKPSKPQQCIAWRGTATTAERMLATETPVALVFDGGTEAVMMATPADLEDFAIGFAVNDGIVTSASDIKEIAVVEVGHGVELRVALGAANRDTLIARRRHRAGPVGCGLCGVESIAEAVPELPPVHAPLTLPVAALVDAMTALATLQHLNRETHAVHAAAFFVPSEGIVAVREDVGRHNALDKLAGALHREARNSATGAVLMTSRISVELVQKAAKMGAPILAAISAPTTLAVEEATKARLTLAGIVRSDGLEVFTHPERIIVHAR